MLQSLKDRRSRLSSGSGALAQKDRVQLNDVQRKMRKIEGHRRAITHLRELAQRDVPSVHNTIASQGDSTLCRRVRYSHKYGAVMVTLVAQLIPLLDLGDLWPSHLMSAWYDYPNDSEGMREEIRRKTGIPAKALLLQVAHGDSPPSTSELNKWLDKLSTSARFMRRLAASQLPDLHETFMSGTTKRDWPENSVFAYFWQTAEDRVLSHVEDLRDRASPPQTPLLALRRFHDRG